MKGWKWLFSCMRGNKGLRWLFSCVYLNVEFNLRFLYSVPFCGLILEEMMYFRHCIFTCQTYDELECVIGVEYRPSTRSCELNEGVVFLLCD